MSQWQRTSRKGRILVLLCGVVLAGSLLLTRTPAASPEPLIILEEDEPQTPYPFLAWTMSEQRLAELLFDRFFCLTGGGAIESRVFTAPWTIRATGMDVSLNPHLKFANGTPVSLDDVAFTLGEVYRRKDLGHRVGEWYAATFGNVEPITPGDGSIPFLVPMPETGAELSLSTTALLSRKSLVNSAGSAGAASSAGSRIDFSASRRRPVGTGPFYPSQTIENFRSISLVRNPHRLSPEGAAPEASRITSLTLLYGQDAAFQKELMEGGRADLWVSPPPSVLPEFRGQSERFGVRSYDLKQWWYVAVNFQNVHLQKPLVREALDLVLPRADLLAKFGGDSATAISGPFLPGSAFAPDDVTPTALDVKLADARMAAAGYRRISGQYGDGQGRITLLLGVEEDIYNDQGDVLFAMVDAWTRFGITVQARPIRPGDWRTLIDTGKAGTTFDLILGRWNVDREAGALELFTGATRSSRSINLFGYANPAVDRVVREFQKERRGPERESLMKGLHRLLHQDRPYLFLWSLQVQSIYRRDRITGFRPSPFYFFTDIEQIARTEGKGE